MGSDKYPKFRAAAVQAAPIFLDRQATVEKACNLILEAAKNGAKLVVFPEVFVPAYPYWSWVDNVFHGSPYFKLLFKNSIEVPSIYTDELCRACREANVYAVVGINEKSKISMGAIWNTNLLLDPDGNILGKHRKLVPTFAEKLTWASGDGSSLKVYDTEIGRLGMLNCGENTNTLARFALLAQGEQVHVANYPALPFGGSGYNMQDAINIRSGAHSFEGKVFNVVSCGALSEEIVEYVCGDSEEKRSLMTGRPNAVSAIYGPEGTPICDPIIDKEGIVYADIDIELSIEKKQWQDIVGYYNRFDIMSLNLNQDQNLPLRKYSQFGLLPGGPKDDFKHEILERLKYLEDLVTNKLESIATCSEDPNR